ncbi:hypothetical protein, partial [Roseospira visakhapatnamensis]|uniref:hypothetical protein n=1 Tax=Roseospira visakhapatnamensis TaxID=390880 RepID=UPI001C841A30
MGSIYVCSYSFWNDSAEHSYLVYDTGSQYVIRGGTKTPIGSVPGSGSFGSGALEVENGWPIELSEDYMGGASIYDRNPQYLDLGEREAGDVWAIMVQHATNIFLENLQYGFDVDYNGSSITCHSVVASALHIVGLDFMNYESDMKGRTWGSGNLIEFDYTLYGTDSDDMILSMSSVCHALQRGGGRVALTAQMVRRRRPRV